MKNTIPIIEGSKVDDEDERLVTFSNELDKRQLEFLDEAGKRIIELSTTLLGILFAVTAFGDKFPPAYIQNNQTIKILVLLTLVLYLAALAAGLLTVQPRKYRQWKANLSGMREELDKIISYKARSFKYGSWLFWAGSFFLSLLIILIIWRA